MIANDYLVNSGGVIFLLSYLKKTRGVLTAWDITKSIAERKFTSKVEEIMTRDVVFAEPDNDLLLIISKLEQYRISAMPVVNNSEVLGYVSSDLITQRYVARFMQDQEFLRL
jgi:predicted transcriptional regulator